MLLYRVDDFIAIYHVFGHLQESISALRCQLSSGVTAQQLHSGREELAQKVQHFRVQLAEGQTLRRKQLTKLTIQSSDAAKTLQEIVAVVR